MNFIAASLLFHSNEVIAFYLFESILNDYKLKDIYLGNLEGIQKHFSIIEAIINSELPELHKHLKNHDITIQMFSTDWIIGLFSSTIPITKI
jgi:hypothetical protein